MSIELYPDQQEAFVKVQASYMAVPVGGRALVVACTGWGKTVLFNALIGWYLKEIARRC